jgi:hypothetical protein
VLQELFKPETKAVSLTLSTISPPFAPLLKNDFGEIEDIPVHIQWNYTDEV